jgi:rod shape-determining protein MreB
MFKNLFNRFSHDMGVDLGTTNTLVYVKGRGIVINEPSVVAVNTKSGKILAIGNEAKRMVGKTPSHITAIRPLVKGVVSDFEATEKMLQHFIEKVHKEGSPFFSRPKIVIGIPLDTTEVERKAVEDAALSAGAHTVYLVEEVMAAAIGARLPVGESVGSMVVDIGGGTTEIAVLALYGIVAAKSIDIAGMELDKYIINFCREEFGLLIGEKTAEELKIALGGVIPVEGEQKEMKVRGRDLLSGLPKESVIGSEQIREAIRRPVSSIIEHIKGVMEGTPPELVADISERGIVLTGGGALLSGLDRAIEAALRIPVHVADDSLTCVVRGTGAILEDPNLLKEVVVPSTKDEAVR